MTSPKIPVLSVAPLETIHIQLERVLTGEPFTVRRRGSLTSALTLLKRTAFPVVVCDRDLPSGSWQHLLARLRAMAQSPSLIVTSRLADEYLWAEALNLGAYDVLAQPFEPEEVRRVVHSALRHWQGSRATPGTVERAIARTARGASY